MTVKSSWRKPFLATLAKTLNVTASCREAKVSRAVVYRARETSATFAKQWDDATDQAVDVLEAAAFTRAVTVSDGLLQFLLKAHRPGMYRDVSRVQHTGGDDGAIDVTLSIMDLAKQAAERGEDGAG